MLRDDIREVMSMASYRTMEDMIARYRQRWARKRGLRILILVLWVSRVGADMARVESGMIGLIKQRVQDVLGVVSLDILVGIALVEN